MSVRRDKSGKYRNNRNIGKNPTTTTRRSPYIRITDQDKLMHKIWEEAEQLDYGIENPDEQSIKVLLGKSKDLVKQIGSFFGIRAYNQIDGIDRKEMDDLNRPEYPNMVEKVFNLNINNVSKVVFCIGKIITKIYFSKYIIPAAPVLRGLYNIIGNSMFKENTLVKQTLIEEGSDILQLEKLRKMFDNNINPNIASNDNKK